MFLSRVRRPWVFADKENYAAAIIAVTAVLTMICSAESLNFSICMVPAFAFRNASIYASILTGHWRIFCWSLYHAGRYPEPNGELVIL